VWYAVSARDGLNSCYGGISYAGREKFEPVCAMYFLDS
jgi:hypothetical protein